MFQCQLRLGPRAHEEWIQCIQEKGQAGIHVVAVEYQDGQLHAGLSSDRVLIYKKGTMFVSTRPDATLQ